MLLKKRLISFFLASLFISSFAFGMDPTESISQGQTYFAMVESKEIFKKISCDSEEMKFLRKNSTYYFFLSESYFERNKKRTCFGITSKGVREELLTLKITLKKYPSEKLSVNQGHVKLSAKDRARVVIEKAHLKEIYANSAPGFYFSTGFIKPTKNEITSYYGNQRLFNHQKSSQHLGTDFRARTPLPIAATNRGRVVLARNYFYEGGIVMLDHGNEIFSYYAHMSQFNVKEGDLVERGATLGLSGATGRISGPHIHWGVKISGSWVDPIQLSEVTRDLAF